MKIPVDARLASGAGRLLSARRRVRCVAGRWWRGPPHV